MLEPTVFKNHQVARVQLLMENPLLHVLFIQVRFGAVALPSEDVKDDELLLVLMWFGDDIGMRSVQVDAECASRLPPVFRYKAEKYFNEIPELPIPEQLDTLVEPRSLNAGMIPDGYRVVFFESQLAVVPFV